MKKVNVAIVGATGVVGRTFLKILEERKFPIKNLYLFSSAKSKGSKIKFNDKEYIVEELKEDSFNRSIITNKDNIKLITEDKKYKPTLSDMLKNPVIINVDSKDNLTEKALKKFIIKELEHFFLELGYGFTYLGSEYKITIDNHHYYIDLLMFNVKLNCYIVLELKTRNFMPKDIGQIEVYMNYIDKNIKEEFNNKTEGIIICKENNKLILKYISNKDIKIINYLLKEKETFF